MTTVKLLFAMNDVPDDFIEEYRQKKGASIVSRRIRRIIEMAACLLLLCILSLPIYHILHPAQMEDPFLVGNERIEFPDMNELSPHASKLRLLEQLPLNKLEIMNIMLHYAEGTDWKNTGNWSSLVLSGRHVGDWCPSQLFGPYTNSELRVVCYFRDKELRDIMPKKVFTKGATALCHIRGVDVYLASYYSIEYAATHYAVFEYDGMVYDVRLESDNAEEILEVLNLMIP